MDSEEVSLKLENIVYILSQAQPDNVPSISSVEMEGMNMRSGMYTQYVCLENPGFYEPGM